MEWSCVVGSVRCHFGKEWSHIHITSKIIHPSKLFMGPRSLPVLEFSFMSNSKGIKGKCPSHLHWGQQSRIFCSARVSLDEDANASTMASSEALIPEKPDSEQLKALFIDSERRRLIRKLSEANQNNRFLKRQLKMKDDDLVNMKSELALLELEIQAMVELAEEAASYGIPSGSRKINGKYIQSHLVSRLHAAHEKIKQQIKDVHAVQIREVTLYWIGMAESVQVMGSFDGWSEGEEMSQEYTGSYANFSTTLRLRPGRYEVKFLVDGVWNLSPELPTVGEGATENNLLIVE